jgi:hypothetical protein
VFQKELYNGIPNATAWQVLRKRLHLKEYKLSIVGGAELEGTLCTLHYQAAADTVVTLLAH